MFDAEKEITKSDLENIEKQFQKLNDSGTFAGDTFDIYITMNILAPKRFNNLEINPTQQDTVLREFKKYKSIRNKDFSRKMCREAKRLKLGAPEVFAKLHFIEKDYENLKEDFVSDFKYKRSDRWKSFFDLLVLFPQKKQELNNLNDNFKEIVKKDRDQGYDRSFIEAIYCKICFPQIYKEKPITDAELKKMKEILEHSRQKGYWGLFADYAFYLKILAAKEVKVTNEGIEVIMPGEKEEIKKTESIPLERNY